VIVADTNVLYALAGRRDERHAGCAGWLRGDDKVLLVPPTVAAETCYRIGRYPGPAARAASRTARAVAAITRSSRPDRPTPTFVAAWLSSCDATPAGTRAGPALV
jgi:predicted nucleic acid-binding protein